MKSRGSAENCHTTSCSTPRSGSSLESCGLAIPAWIARGKIPAIEAPNCLAAPELIVVVHSNKVMPALPELVERSWRETFLAADLHTLYPPEPWAVAGRLRVLAVVSDAHHHLHVTLRLHRATHHTEAHHRGAVFGDKAGDDRVVRPLVRPDLIRMPVSRSEIRAAILQRNAGAWHHHTGAEAHVVRLDHRHHHP